MLKPFRNLISGVFKRLSAERPSSIQHAKACHETTFELNGKSVRVSVQTKAADVTAAVERFAQIAVSRDADFRWKLATELVEIQQAVHPHLHLDRDRLFES